MEPAFRKSLILILLGISLFGLIIVEAVAVNYKGSADPCHECQCICSGKAGGCIDCNGDPCVVTDLEPLLLLLPLITSIVIIMFIFQRKSRSLIH